MIASISPLMPGFKSTSSITEFPNKPMHKGEKALLPLLPKKLSGAARMVNTVTHSGVDWLVRKYRRGVVNSLLEYLILNFVQKDSLCGYDIISGLFDRFHVLLSPGQVYPVINYLDEHGLIGKERQGRRVLLRLTPLGETFLEAWRQELTSIQLQMSIPVIVRESPA